MEWGCKGFYRRNEGVYGCLFKHACGWNVVEKQLGKLVESWKACEGAGNGNEQRCFLAGNACECMAFEMIVVWK